MKFLKIAPIFVVAGLFIGITSCQESNSDPKEGPELSCDWPAEYSIDTTIEDMTGKVRSVITGDSTKVFLIDIPELQSVAVPGYLLPCNLPDSAKKDGLEIKVSGHVMTFPKISSADILGNPFEISFIDGVRK